MASATLPLQGAGAIPCPDNPMIPEFDMEEKFVWNLEQLKTRGPFDFIVVGAGAGGCAFLSGLARSLANCQVSQKLKNLLIEAGPEAQNSRYVTIPNYAACLWRSEVGMHKWYFK